MNTQGFTAPATTTIPTISRKHCGNKKTIALFNNEALRKQENKTNTLFNNELMGKQENKKMLYLTMKHCGNKKTKQMLYLTMN